MARAMKDSGVEWSGEIPEDWRVSQLKKHVLVNNGKEIDVELGPGDEGAIPVYGSGGVFKYTNRPMFSGEAVMFGRKGTLGAPLYVKTAFWSVDTMYYLTFSDTLVARFNYYQMLVFDWAPLITHTALPSIVASKVVACKFAFPSVAEQQRIADFLDAQTAEIDASIAKTQESIEEYKKLKQAVITQAVTKGIRPGRVMKDSGAEWWPVVSEACKITHLGRVCTVTLGKMLTPEPKGTSDTLERYFCAANVHFGSVDEGPGLKRMWFSPKEKADYAVAEGDMLVVEGGAGAGGAAIVKRLDSPTYIQNSIMIVRGGALCDNRYVCYALESLVKRGYIDIACNKATIPHFTKDKLSTTSIPYRDIAEQQEIAAYLDEKCAAIDTLIEKKQAIITELEAYKKSLIYEYVTGKKEVPVASC